LIIHAENGEGHAQYAVSIWGKISDQRVRLRRHWGGNIASRLEITIGAGAVHKKKFIDVIHFC
jgi:hypothetical protein